MRPEIVAIFLPVSLLACLFFSLGNGSLQAGVALANREPEIRDMSAFLVRIGCIQVSLTFNWLGIFSRARIGSLLPTRHGGRRRAHPCHVAEWGRSGDVIMGQVGLSLSGASQAEPGFWLLAFGLAFGFAFGLTIGLTFGLTFGLTRAPPPRLLDPASRRLGYSSPAYHP